ncbi:MAG: hypothetical protein JO069_19095, partial [Verrucomicrobia bacterium]|nr:hypothetical protein [Verrucomicrobiota bacterium]
MKRFLVGSVLFLCLGIGVVLWHFELRPLPAARLAPAEAELFVEWPNLARTADRWPATALSHILNEPSVQRFCGCPWHALPEGYQLIWTHLVKLQPTSAFFCSVDVTRREWLLGLRCASSLRGWQQDAQSLASNFFGGQFVELESNARAGMVRQPGDAVVYGLRCGSWLLFGSDPSVVRAAFDRRTRTQDGLETCEAFQRCQAKITAGPDMITFAQGPLAAMIPLPSCTDNPKGRRALIAATTLDGAQIRDQVFTLGPCDQGATPPVSRKALEMTSVDTVFYASTHAELSTWQQMAHVAAGSWGVAETFDQYFDALTNAGINVRELDRVLGDLEIVIEREPVSD